MKKLKNKVFYVIFFILTTFLISILVIFNYQNYQREKNNIKNSFMRMDESRNGNRSKLPDIIEPTSGIKKNNQSEPRLFMDANIYTAILDKNSNIVEVINHTTNEVSDETIKNMADNIIKNRGKTNTKIVAFIIYI